MKLPLLDLQQLVLVETITRHDVCVRPFVWCEEIVIIPLFFLLVRDEGGRVLVPD